MTKEQSDITIFIMKCLKTIVFLGLYLLMYNISFSYFDIPVSVLTIDGREYKGRMFSTRFPPYGRLKGLHNGEALEISILIVKTIEILDANPKTIEVVHLGNEKRIKLTDAEFSIDPYIDTDMGRIILPWKKIKKIDLWVDLRKCPSCGRTMLQDWFFCPFDGVKLPETKTEKTK